MTDLLLDLAGRVLLAFFATLFVCMPLAVWNQERAPAHPSWQFMGALWVLSLLPAYALGGIEDLQHKHEYQVLATATGMCLAYASFIFPAGRPPRRKPPQP